ncbi:YrhB domain-containing protein [Paraburkholderia tropica]|uniref:YrhB domain-containing protein n=1 Tax=Paraburkholderia tropica TaxID=92647 RepID=UPI0032B3A944
MTLDLATAKKLALDYLAEQQSRHGGVPYSIVDSRIMEDENGWYFPYQSVEFLTTGDMNDFLVGNWPVFVSRDGLHVGPCRPEKLQRRN